MTIKIGKIEKGVPCVKGRSQRFRATKHRELYATLATVKPGESFTVDGVTAKDTSTRVQYAKKQKMTKYNFSVLSISAKKCRVFCRESEANSLNGIQRK